MVSSEEQFKYIHYLKNISIYFAEEYNKLNKNIYSLDLYCINKFINKLPNTLINLTYSNYAYKYLNNLPLNLKYLFYNRVNCNLPPNIIYLECYYYCDLNNLPRSLQFIYIYIFNKTKIAKELIEHNYNYNNINFIDYYKYIIKLNSIY